MSLKALDQLLLLIRAIGGFPYSLRGRGLCRRASVGGATGARARTERGAEGGAGPRARYGRVPFLRLYSLATAAFVLAGSALVWNKRVDISVAFVSSKTVDSITCFATRIEAAMQALLAAYLACAAPRLRALMLRLRELGAADAGRAWRPARDVGLVAFLLVVATQHVGSLITALVAQPRIDQLLDVTPLEIAVLHGWLTVRLLGRAVLTALLYASAQVLAAAIARVLPPLDAEDPRGVPPPPPAVGGGVVSPADAFEPLKTIDVLSLPSRGAPAPGSRRPPMGAVAAWIWKSPPAAPPKTSPQLLRAASERLARASECQRLLNSYFCLPVVVHTLDSIVIITEVVFCFSARTFALPFLPVFMVLALAEGVALVAFTCAAPGAVIAQVRGGGERIRKRERDREGKREREGRK